MSQRLDRRPNQFGKVIDQIGGGELAMGIRQGGIPGNVDEAKSRLYGCFVHGRVRQRNTPARARLRA